MVSNMNRQTWEITHEASNMGNNTNAPGEQHEASNMGNNTNAPGEQHEALNMGNNTNAHA